MTIWNVKSIISWGVLVLLEMINHVENRGFLFSFMCVDVCVCVFLIHTLHTEKHH